MDRRKFSKSMLLSGLAIPVINTNFVTEPLEQDVYKEGSKKLPVRDFDVVVAGGGTAGVVAAIAAARQGAKTALVEAKGYPGGTVVEGGTALHSFFNLWKAFPGVEKRQVVKGIPQEIIDRLLLVGGTSGHAEMLTRYNYDSVCTSIDTELYKLVAFEMLAEAGVFICVNTLVAGAVKKGSAIEGVITESRLGRELFKARCFIDCTAYGDLSAHAGAEFIELNDHAVCNSMGMGNINIERLHDYLKSIDAVGDYSLGIRDGKDGQIIRMGSEGTGRRAARMHPEFVSGIKQLGSGLITTTVHDNYLMFIKVNYKMKVSPTNRDEVAKVELLLRQNQYKTLELFRKYLPGCENAFIARTSPSLNIRRGRTISCDYDITSEDVTEGRHFDDEIMAYGFHDEAPRLQIKNGGTYGIPLKALRVKNIDNLLAAGMMITSDRHAHMSTRNTVCCMGQGQAAGTAAALCASKEYGTRDLTYSDLRSSLEKNNVYFES
ncbi:MAG TPA: FAD-dependent oxidoreductase [Bacteroidales bacterium]|nr:FAD-dependent oxidoreductase [Bacteroidales bacterium]